MVGPSVRGDGPRGSDDLLDQLLRRSARRPDVLIDCDTCTVRGEGCGDCVVTVLLGAPPGVRGGAATVVPLGRRPLRAGQPTLPGLGEAWGAALGAALVSGPTRRGRVLEFDDVERRALHVLAEMGLVPPLRHQAPPARDVG